MEGWTSASKVRDRSQSTRGGTKTEGNVWARSSDGGRDGDGERGSEGVGGRWVGADKAELWRIKLVLSVFQSWRGWGTGTLLRGLWKISATSRRPVCGLPFTHSNNTHTHTYKHKNNIHEHKNTPTSKYRHSQCLNRKKLTHYFLPLFLT